MKKTILALLFLGSGSALLGQGRQNTGSAMTGNTADSVKVSGYNNNMSTGNYNAFGTAGMTAPPSIQFSFQNSYPNATDAAWQQSADWWRVNYKNNGQDMSMFYNMAGQNYLLALPVLANLVPQEVVARAKEQYGYNLYDITAMKGSNGHDIYGIRIIDNGQARMERINADGSAYTELMVNNKMNNGTTNGDARGTGTNWNNQGSGNLSSGNTGSTAETNAAGTTQSRTTGIDNSTGTEKNNTKKQKKNNRQ